MTFYILKEIICNQYNQAFFKHFSYLNWNHFSNIMNGEFCTTTNASESINSPHHGEIKMNKVRTKTLDRQAKIKQCLESISFMDIESEIAGLPQLLNDIGLANPSDFTLEQIPSDFLYLAKIFD